MKKEIRLKIKAQADREAIVIALANNGYKVWVEKEEKTSETTYIVVFEIYV